ncbi:TIGR01212 family radical SAM protein [Butyrivibrio sp. CB08]|uniref:TIGR01212 family radical SAM protein n=1 Tax=Butyrivibrio sp. CB08 TaxID=2364879 RepID=UPI000EAA56A4|nr:TIGR01212 family radical SAM protein [Butyrivibrio sp. CB08]RKM59265.1 TIGR01212 family radical SAM protein [Butyrivibrio sp. CB08]
MSGKVTLLNEYLRDRFGCKVYKIALNGGFTCPNRDGKIDTRGCIFCSEGGSGEFAQSARLSVTEQIELGKRKVEKKIKDGKYIAYFQAYTGTYDKVERLRALFTEAIDHPDIVVLSVATRPDCLPEEVLDLLEELNRIKPVWVELGLQTIHEQSARYIRRGYELSVYDEAIAALRSRGIEVITHLIIGLPGESKSDILESVDYVCKSGANGIKLQLLHILKGTDLQKEYEQGRVTVLSEDEYVDILKECVEIIPENVVIHRLTGDGDKKILIAPMWSGNKKHVWNHIQKDVL